MFTGLIEEVGTISAIEATGGGARLTVSARRVVEGAQLGDSIAIDGCCTTAVALTDDSFTIDASPETLSKTTMRFYKPGTRVNLERPLTPTARLGGHFVTGHVDGLALVLSREVVGNSVIFSFKLEDDAFGALLIPKGSITVNGISLTVNTVSDDIFTVAIIPHTLAHTNLDDFLVNDLVNIETDLLGKYVQRLMYYRPGADQGESQAEGVEKPFGDMKIFEGQWFCHDEEIHGPMEKPGTTFGATWYGGELHVKS